MTDQTLVGLDIDGTELHMGDRVHCVNSTGIFLPENRAYFQNPQDTFILISENAIFDGLCCVQRCCDGKIVRGWDTRRFRRVLPPTQVTRRLTVKVSNPNE